MADVSWIDTHTTLLTRDDGSTVRSQHASHRSAQVYVAAERLRASGWRVRGPASSDGFRLPLMLKGERMVTPLDGAKVDQRAQGFTATKGAAILQVDACADMETKVTLDVGETAEALAIVCEVFPDVDGAALYRIDFDDDGRWFVLSPNGQRINCDNKSHATLTLACIWEAADPRAEFERMLTEC